MLRSRSRALVPTFNVGMHSGTLLRPVTHNVTEGIPTRERGNEKNGDFNAAFQVYKFQAFVSKQLYFFDTP